MGRLFDRIVDRAGFSVAEARERGGLRACPGPASRPLAGWTAGATLDSGSAEPGPARAMPGEGAAGPREAFTADSARNADAHAPARPGALTPPSVQEPVEAQGNAEPFDRRPIRAPGRPMAAAAWAETKPASRMPAPVESLRVPTVPRAAREQALAGARVEEPEAPRTRHALVPEASVPELADREAAPEVSPGIGRVARMAAAAEPPRPSVPDDHPDPLGAYLEVAPRPVPAAPVPSPALRSPPPPAAGLTIDHLDVRVIAEPPAPAERGASRPPAPPPSGAWRTAARYYLGRL
jgi:hypothetical protein